MNLPGYADLCQRRIKSLLIFENGKTVLTRHSFSSNFSQRVLVYLNYRSGYLGDFRGDCMILLFPNSSLSFRQNPLVVQPGQILADFK